MLKLAIYTWACCFCCIIIIIIEPIEPTTPTLLEETRAHKNPAVNGEKVVREDFARVQKHFDDFLTNCGDDDKAGKSTHHLY